MSWVIAYHKAERALREVRSIIRKRFMTFIDGGYLRAIVRENIGEYATKDYKEYYKIIDNLIQTISSNYLHSRGFELVRTYYYDAIHLPTEPEFKDQNEFFKNLQKSLESFEIKLGRLIKGKELKQKGVDVLLSIDLVTKAFLDHYDLAVLVAGDDDFVDAVKIVKDYAGKKVAGVYQKERASERLIECFDFRYPILPGAIKK